MEHMNKRMAMYILNEMTDCHGTPYDFNEMVSLYHPDKIESEVRRVANNHGLTLYPHLSEWDMFIAYMVCLSDYPKSITSDEARYIWVAEYFSDPDADHCKLFRYFFY